MRWGQTDRSRPSSQPLAGTQGPVSAPRAPRAEGPTQVCYGPAQGSQSYSASRYSYSYALVVDRQGFNIRSIAGAITGRVGVPLRTVRVPQSATRVSDDSASCLAALPRYGWGQPWDFDRTSALTDAAASDFPSAKGWPPRLRANALFAAFSSQLCSACRLTSCIVILPRRTRRARRKSQHEALNAFLQLGYVEIH